MKVYYCNFWNGFIDGSDGVNCTFFNELFSLVFGTQVSPGGPDESDILCESIFGPPWVQRKQWTYSFLFSGEARLNGVEHLYTAVLYGERNHKNIVNCPLFVPYMWCSGIRLTPLKSTDYTELLPLNKIDMAPSKNKVLCVIGNDGGVFRNQFLDRMEARGVPIDYGGRFRQNISDPRITQSRYWSPEYLEAIGEYKFVLAMENTQGDTYITEKIVNPLAAATIPIYWGSPRITDYFNEEKCILVNEQNQDICIDRILRLLQSDEEYDMLLHEPGMIEHWRNLNDIAKDIKALMTPEGHRVPDSVRVISSSLWEPERYKSMCGVLGDLGVPPCKAVISASTYKHTIYNYDYDRFVRQPMHQLLDVHPSRKMKMSELSLTLNYYSHLTDIDKRYKDGVFLTLESDASLLPEAAHGLPVFLNLLQGKTDWSLFSLGWGGAEQLQGLPEENGYAPFQVVRKCNTRCTDSLLWSKSGIEKFLQHLKGENFSEPFDHYLSRFMDDNMDNFKFYWVEPPFFKQLSNYGNLASTIR